MKRELRRTDLVHVRYADHVLYHHMDPHLLMPQERECVGWLLREEDDFIAIAWDRETGSVSLAKAEAKASGLVIMRTDILEVKRIDACFSRPPLLRGEK